MDPNCSQVLQADVEVAEPGLFLKKVHELYHREFWRWFGILAPTSVLAGIVLLLADSKIRSMFAGMSFHDYAQHPDEIAIGFVLRYGAYYLSWFLGCFALAAIATVVNRSDGGDEEANWRQDSYQNAREHLGQVFLLGFITFLTFLVIMAGLEFVGFAAIRVVGRARFFRFNYAWSAASVVLAGSVVSWLGIAIPLIVKSNTAVLAGLKKSVTLSSGYEGALFLLVVESVAGGLLAWYVVLHGAPWVVPSSWRYEAWYGWFLNLAGVLASAAVDPPLFIGLSLLANREQLARSLPGAEEAAGVY